MTVCPQCGAPLISANNGADQYCPLCHAESREPLVSRMMGAAQMPPVTAERPEKGTQKRHGAYSGVVACLNLPYPLTTNNLYRTGKNGCRYKTKEAAAYHEEAGQVARLTVPAPLAGRLAVSVVISPKRGVGMDLDNACKCCLDSLTGVVWNDDSQIWRLTVERTGPVKGGALVVSVEEYREEAEAI